MWEGLMGLYALAAVAGLALTIAFIVGFFMIMMDVRKIRDSLATLAIYRKVELIEAGIVDPATGKTAKWKYGEGGAMVPRVDLGKAPPMEPSNGER
jgi:hypothetical protein